MSRQLDEEREVRAAKRSAALMKALDYGIVGALQTQGIDLLGLSIRYDAFNCLLTIRADIGGVRSVCFVGSDSIANCYLKAESDASRDALKWRPDAFYVGIG